MEIIFQFVIAGFIMGVLDFIWLGFIAKKLYYKEMGGLLRKKPNMFAALLFYIIYVIGVTVFVINPAVNDNNPIYALGYGVLFGLVTYATYDLTNLATIRGFSKKIVAIDLVWGMVITMVVSLGSYAAVTMGF